MGKFKKVKHREPSHYHIKTVHIWSDGSVRPDGNASYAYLLFSEALQDILKIRRHACRDGTINAMELSAIDKALDWPGLTHVVIHTDSAYCIGCLSLWRHNWVLNDWITPSGTPVKNKEIIESIGKKLDKLESYSFEKVKAHSGNPLNTVVDYLAQGLTKKMSKDSTIVNQVESW